MSECIKDRRTGRTTGIALRLISESYNRPGFVYFIKDHYDHPIAHRSLRHLIEDMVNELELKGFVFNSTNNTMEYRGLCNCKVVQQSIEEFPCTCPNCKKANP